jgi:adenylate cyclase
MVRSAEQRRLVAVMFADVVGYSRLMAADEETGVRARRRHRKIARPLVEAYGGRWVEERGDESLSVFPSALDAVNCALAIQAATASEPDLSLRVGIDLGDVVFDQDEVYGDGVNVAARVRETAEPGATHVTRRVVDSVKNQKHINARELGEHQLKNVSRPLRLFSITGTSGPPPRSSSAPPAATQERVQQREIRSIAVLPLVNVSRDEQEEPFVDGMTESLIGKLAKIRSLHVVSRTTTMRYAGARKPLPEIARELDVEGVIEGSVQREADRVRVTLRLIDGFTDRLRWSESYERHVHGVLALQSEIARSVAREIRLQLTPHEEEALASPLGRWFARVRRLGIPED